MSARQRLRTAVRTRGLASIPAGLVDSGLSSLSTFLVGLAAVRYLPVEALGVYALAYGAFLLGSAVSAMLVHAPAEVATMREREGTARLSVLPRSVRLGLPVGTVAGAAVGALSLLVPSSAPLAVRVSFALSVVLLCAVSPLQDSTRRVLHMADRSWTAARTSGVQLAVVVVGLAAIVASGQADRDVVPFGVLTLANVVSAGYALVTARRARPGPPPAISLVDAGRQGRPLLVGTVAQFSTGFVLVGLVTAFAGLDDAARFEAARLLAQPVSVVVVGVLAVLGPRIMSAALAGDEVRTMRQVRTCLAVSLGLAVPYAAVLALPWDGNPLRLLAPRGFEVELLVPLMVLSQAVTYSLGAFRNVPVALGRGDTVLRVETSCAVLTIVAGVLLASSGARGAVIAGLLGALAQLALFWRLDRSLVRGVARDAAGA